MASAAGVTGCACAAPASRWQASRAAARVAKRDVSVAIMGQSFLSEMSRPLDDAPAVRTGDDGRLGQSDEKPVLDDARNSSQRRAKRARIGDLSERSVEDEMPTVRDESVAGRGLAQRQSAGIATGGDRRLHGALGGAKAERHHLD